MKYHVDSIYELLNKTSSRIVQVQVAAASRLNHEFRILFAPKVKIKNCTSSVCSRNINTFFCQNFSEFLAQMVDRRSLILKSRIQTFINFDYSPLFQLFVKCRNTSAMILNKQTLSENWSWYVWVELKTVLQGQAKLNMFFKHLWTLKDFVQAHGKIQS